MNRSKMSTSSPSCLDRSSSPRAAPSGECTVRPWEVRSRAGRWRGSSPPRPPPACCRDVDTAPGLLRRAPDRRECALRCRFDRADERLLVAGVEHGCSLYSRVRCGLGRARPEYDGRRAGRASGLAAVRPPCSAMRHPPPSSTSSERVDPAVAGSPAPSARTGPASRRPPSFPRTWSDRIPVIARDTCARRSRPSGVKTRFGERASLRGSRRPLDCAGASLRCASLDSSTRSRSSEIAVSETVPTDRENGLLLPEPLRRPARARRSCRPGSSGRRTTESESCVAIRQA